jgi:isoleucyl-tRNA synthetase
MPLTRHNPAPMQDYKNTLNLPTTEFPMKANLAVREPEILSHWESIKLYQQLRELGKKRSKKYVLMDGPPYANGHLHIGHALQKTLKDIVVKSKTLSGFDAPFVPGWDCHGLPIELNVEKKVGKAGVAISPKEFREACRAYATSQIDIQRAEFKRLGTLGDWEHPYRTMDFTFEANIIRALAKVIANGHLVQGFKPVHWCIDCGSALAEAEVEYANKVSPAIDVRFRVADEAAFLKSFTEKNLGTGTISVPIWTTTPWTLPANEAVALHPEIEYVLVQVKIAEGVERLLIAEPLLTTVLTRYGATEIKQLAKAQGAVFEKLLLQHPFYDKQVPIVLGEHVTTETGTGAVHTAPAHGQEDYVVGQHYHLPLVNPVGSNGCFLANTLLVAGEHVFKANPHVIELLAERKNLLAKENLEHSYPHCWRHKTPLIFLATPQWFIAIPGQLLETASVAAATNVNWVPDWGLTNMTGMLTSRPDWCISRQRNWGTPITLFIHKQTRQLHPNMVQLMEKIAERIETESMEVWFASTPETWLGAEGKDYEKVTDTLDVWFDSGVVHFATLTQHPDLIFPADLYLEGTDQYRGWFQSSLLTAIAMQVSEHKKITTAQAPYRTVLTHGFTVDEAGRKMSKSLGNVVSVEKAVQNHGADVLRLWVAATDYRGEVAYSDNIIKNHAETYRRIRNTLRYLLSNLSDFKPEHDLVPEAKMLSLDRWMVHRAEQLQQEIIKAYEDFQFHVIYQKLHNFCVIDLGGFYLDVTKDRQYTMQANSLGRRSAQTAMFHLAEAMVRWLAPILSFTAEEAWRYLPGKRGDSVFLSTWYENLKITNVDDAFWQSIIQVREAVNKEIEKCRNEGEIGSALEAAVTLYCQANSKLAKNLLMLNDELRFVLITSAANVETTVTHPDAVLVQINNEELGVKVTALSFPKCARCWHRREDVGSVVEHPTICVRCVKNLSENTGEKRLYL